MFNLFRQGHLEMIVFLMKHGADPSSQDIEGMFGVQQTLRNLSLVILSESRKRNNQNPSFIVLL